LPQTYAFTQSHTGKSSPNQVQNTLYLFRHSSQHTAVLPPRTKLSRPPLKAKAMATA
jgi:hypothetical protein